jgi:hypothetical protein
VRRATSSMEATLPALIGAVPRNKVTEAFAPEANPSVTARQSVKWEEIPEIAFDRARLERKRVADEIGKSNSWFCRALKGVQKLGWIDLGAIKDKEFWREMVEMICAAQGIEPPGMTADDMEALRIGKAQIELHRQIAKAVSR